VRQGTVDFSTTIFEVVETSAMRRVASWRKLRSAAKPAPIPDFLVGVLTETKMRLER
jgi:hypothetical protein